MKLIVSIAVLLLAPGLGGALGEAGPAPLTELRTLLEQYIDTQRKIAEAREKWRVGKDVLQARSDLVFRETDDLRRMTQETTANMGEADTNLTELKAAQAALKAGAEGLYHDIVELEQRVGRLIGGAPDPVRERVQVLVQRIPDNPETTKMGLSERFLNVVGILNELNKFSMEINEASEVRALPDGSNAEVSVLYLGLSYAYFSNPDGGVAGFGRPSPGGWQWESRPDLVDPVTLALRVSRNEVPAVYVTLPFDGEPAQPAPPEVADAASD